MKTRSGQTATANSKVKIAKADVAPSVREIPKSGQIVKTPKERITAMVETKNKAVKQRKAKLREESRVKSMTADQVKMERKAVNQHRNAEPTKKAERVQTVRNAPKKNAPRKSNAAGSKGKGNSSVETKRGTRSGR